MEFLERKRILAVYVLLALASVAAPYLLWSFWFPWMDLLQLLNLRIVWLISLVAMLPLIFLVRIRASIVDTEPSAGLGAFVRMYRGMGYDVTEMKDRVSVRIDGLASVNLRTKPAQNGTVLSFQVSATPKGWSIIILTGFLLPQATLPVSLLILWRVLRFVEQRVLPQIPHLPAIASAPRDTKAVLIDSLSEGHRLALEAFEAERSSYQDKTLIVLVLGAFVLVASVMLLRLAPAFEGVREQGFWACASLCLLATIILVVPALLALRSRVAPRILKLRRQVSRLEAALALEAKSGAPPDGTMSSFEIVVDAWREMPRWLEARRRGGTFRDPGPSVLIFVLVYAAGMVLLYATIYPLMFLERVQPGYALLPAAVSLSLVFLAFLVYRRWRKSCLQEVAEIRTDWKRRLDSIQREMERLLQEV